MAKISRTVEIDAPAERVYAFMTNPENIPEVWPSLLEATNVQLSEDGSHSFDFVYKMAGKKFDGHAETTEVEKNRRAVVNATGGIPSTLHYKYESLGSNKMRFTMETDYTLPSKLLSRLAEPFLRRINEHEADLVVHNLKARMELGDRAQPEARPHA